MNATSIFHLTFVERAQGGELIYHAAITTPEHLPVYFELVVYKGRLELIQPIDVYGPVGATQSPLELVESAEDDSTLYTTELLDPTHLDAPMSLLIGAWHGKLTSAQTLDAWMLVA